MWSAKRRQQLVDRISLEVRRSQSRTDAYDEAVANALGLNRTDFRCLDILSTEGTITAGRLAELMGVTSGAMTSVLDRLESAGFARRIRDTDDRRRVHVELTPKLHEQAWPYYQPLLEMSVQRSIRATPTSSWRCCSTFSRPRPSCSSRSSPACGRSFPKRLRRSQLSRPSDSAPTAAGSSASRGG